MYSQSSINFLKNKNYLKNGETFEQRIEDICSVVKKYEKDYSKGLSERIKHYIREKIFIPSTPQLSNLGRKKEKGSSPLPASCYILGVENSIQGIYYSHAETAIMSKLGGGVGTSWINVIEEGSMLDEGFYSNSKLDWIEDGLRSSQKVSQSNVRRGYSVPTISIEDKEYEKFIERLDKKNPDKKDPLIKNNGCVLLPKGFWEKLPNDPVLKKRFIDIINKRMAKGKIYLLDETNCNKNQSPVYEKLGLSVNATNICCEAVTALLSGYSFVCMLSSINLEKWDIIEKDPDIIKDFFMFLDINISEYIKLTKGVKFMEKARKSAKEKRDIGLGTLGFHDLLRKKGYSFGGLQSRILNKKIYSTIQQKGLEYSEEISNRLGSPKMCKKAGLKRRNVSLMMIAPNKSTAGIAETSEGVNPRISNYFNEELTGINRVYKCKYLTKILEEKNKNTSEVWNSILENSGSVQHLDFLTEEQKSVFKTASEISPKDIIDLAADRQKYIDMSQSINLWGRPNYKTQDVYNIHKYAFEKGLKTLYYYFSQGHAAIEKNNNEAWDTCEACAD